MITPTVVVVVIIVVIPVLWTILLAFQRIRLIDLRNGPFGPFTMRNFARVFAADGLVQSLLVTFVYAFVSTIGSTIVGLIVALALRRTFHGRGIVRGLMLLPYVAPIVAVTFCWTTMLDPNFGIINAWGTRFFGWDNVIPFLSHSRYALSTVIVFDIWRYFPFAFLFITARLAALPSDLEEAARVDGATPLQRFLHIVLPQLWGVMSTLLVVRFIFSFNKFDDVFLLTGGGAGTEVVAVRIYNYVQGTQDLGAAAAQALLLAAILVLLMLLYFRANRRTSEGSVL